MTDTCPDCAGGPRQQTIKEISSIPDSRICRCTSCGAFWSQVYGEWGQLLPADDFQLNIKEAANG